eukprot:TRINITY_DN57689_c0_g1_i1.p1 TRINITY_DN57689_c0_g1~~TRINITY_DN57689_c0_g1_i1.p1  ORF type:complete len:216 (-),score=35.41 TRINITY_DN57689_c0_g1_i1:156-722(-)
MACINQSSQPLVSRVGGSSGAKRTILLADLLPPPPSKKQRVEHPLDVQHVEGTVCIFGDDVSLKDDLNISDSLDELGESVAGTAQMIRAALPHVFGSEARNAYQERTGNFGGGDPVSLQATETELRRTVPHLFGGKTGRSWSLADKEQFDAWADSVRSRFAVAATLAERILETSSDSEEDDQDEKAVM